jgi:hypothetical protein
MLDLATCKQLKDAGFPQNEQCNSFYYRDCTSTLGRGERDRSEWPSVAECPNSDELIAYIHSRWGIRASVRYDHDLGWIATTGSVQDYADGKPGIIECRSRRMPGNDIDEAFAELVITLDIQEKQCPDTK